MREMYSDVLLKAPLPSDGLTAGAREVEVHVHTQGRFRRQPLPTGLPPCEGRDQADCGSSPTTASGQLTTGQGVQRAPNRATAQLENVGVDHGRCHVRVPKEFLRRANVASRPQQVGGETVA